MERIKRLLAFAFSSAFGLFFLVATVLSLPLNILAVMRLWGWEWWGALIVVGVYSIIPLLGQIAYVVFTFIGAYYLIDANWSWKNAADGRPKTFTFSDMSAKEFERFKIQNIVPQLTKQCLDDIKNRYGVDGKISTGMSNFCDCYAKVAVAVTTQSDLAYQDANKTIAPEHALRLEAGVRASCTR